MKRVLPVALLALLLPGAAHAGSPPTRTEILLVESRTPAELRSRLRAFADSIAPSWPFGSGEACAALGASFERAGQIDSAIVWYGRATERRGDTSERLGLVDALLARGRPEDLQRAIAQLRRNVAGIEAPTARLPYEARLAWALHRAGKPDSAATAFALIENDLAPSVEWSEHMGFACLDARRPGAAMRWLSPVAVASRGRAKDVMDALRASGEAMPAGSSRADFTALIGRQVAVLDYAEEDALAPLKARRLSFNAGDGFPLGAVVVTPAAAKRRLGAVVMIEPGQSPLSCDSLVQALLRANLAVLLLERRGFGHSVGPACLYPHAWHGREAALEERCARDAAEALRALAGATALDTSRYLVAGIGETATTAVRAATLDRRVAALLLVSPAPHPVDRGVTRARLAGLKRPVFFQIAPEDFPIFELTDVLYQAGDRSRSRVADARGAGRGAEQFRHDPAVLERLTRWLNETLAAAAPSPRRARPRRG